MKRFGLLLTVVLVVFIMMGMTLSVLAAKAGKTSAKGQEVSLTGKLTCTFCALSHPGQACPKGCCAKCIKAGDPPLLTDAKGNMYILLTNELQVPLMTPERLAMTDGKVVVKGLLVKGKGIQVIYVDSMKKA